MKISLLQVDYIKHKDTKKQSSFFTLMEESSIAACYKGHNVRTSHPQGFVATFMSLVTFLSVIKPLSLCVFVFYINDMLCVLNKQHALHYLYY